MTQKVKFYEFYIIDNFGELLYFEDLSKSGMQTDKKQF